MYVPRFADQKELVLRRVCCAGDSKSKAFSSASFSELLKIATRALDQAIHSVEADCI